MRGILHHEDWSWSNAPRGGGGGTTTSTQNTAPWSGQQPYLSDIYSKASQYASGPGPQYFPTDTYIQMTPQQRSAIGQIYGTGMAGGTAPLQSAASANAATTDPAYTGATSGAFDASNPAIANFGSGSLLNATNPAFLQGQNYLSGMINGTGVMPAAGAALQNQGLLSNEIGGAYLNPASNPGFQNVVNTTLANVMPGITAGFAGAGRSDSGLAARAASQGATDAIGGLTLQNYLAERQSQNAAGQQAMQNLLAEQGLQQGAAAQAGQNQATGLGATEAAQTLASNNLLRQQANQLQAQGLAPLLDQTQFGDLQAALQAAGLTQQDSQNNANDAIARYNYNQMLPYNQLQLYSSMIQNGNPGSSTTLTQPYFSNTGANIATGLGAAASVATIAAVAI